MVETLKKLYKLVKLIANLLPAIISAIEDFADDGKLNNSNK